MKMLAPVAGALQLPDVAYQVIEEVRFATHPAKKASQVLLRLPRFHGLKVRPCVSDVQPNDDQSRPYVLKQRIDVVHKAYESFR